jgi:hypothetical protein
MKKIKIGTMDKILVIVAVFLVVFVAIMLWMYYVTGGIPDTLCTCVFACCGGECGVMGWIKTNKDKCRDREYELEDRERSEKAASGGIETPPEPSPCNSQM